MTNLISRVTSQDGWTFTQMLNVYNWHYQDLSEEGRTEDSHPIEQPSRMDQKISAARQLLGKNHQSKSTDCSKIRLILIPNVVSVRTIPKSRQVLEEEQRVLACQMYQLQKVRALDSYVRSMRARLSYCRYLNKSVNESHMASIFVNPLKMSQLQDRNLLVPLYEQICRRGCEQDQNIEFDSRFQSGNLLCAARTAKAEYDLVLQNDVNTIGYTQWFYFRIYCLKTSLYKLNICNMVTKFVFQYKARGGQTRCMKPVYSSTDGAWKRIPGGVHYSQNDSIREGPKVYSLSFSLQLQAGNVYEVAYSFPYTVTDLNTFISGLRAKRLQYLKIRVIATSLMKIDIPLVQISSGSADKQVIWVIGRQHSGESPASFVAVGIIEYLTSPTPEAQYLRSQFNFKIVPLVNVDGTINGSYRTNLSGQDLNRRWDFPSKAKHPEIYCIKQQVLGDGKKVKLVLDLHAHSKKARSFFYGAKSSQNNRILPYQCAQLSPQFSFEDCSFSVHKTKQCTARAILSSSLPDALVYTYEVSFMGDCDDSKITHYQEGDYIEMGKTVAQAIYMMYFYLLSINKGKTYLINLTAKQKVTLDRVRQTLANLGHKIVVDYQGSGSDSDPEMDSIDPIEIKSHYMSKVRFKPRLSAVVWRPTNKTIQSFSRKSNTKLIRRRRQKNDLSLFCAHKSSNSLDRALSHTSQPRQRTHSENVNSYQKLQQSLILNFDQKSKKQRAQNLSELVTKGNRKVLSEQPSAVQLQPQRMRQLMQKKHVRMQFPKLFRNESIAKHLTQGQI